MKKDIEDKLMDRLKLAGRELRIKKPTVLMNLKDFEKLLEITAEKKSSNLKIGDPPTFQGIPISMRESFPEGEAVVYDDYFGWKQRLKDKG